MIICETMPKSASSFSSHRSSSVRRCLPKGMYTRNASSSTPQPTEPSTITHDIGTLKSICGNLPDRNIFGNITSSGVSHNAGNKTDLNRTCWLPIECVINLSETDSAGIPVSASGDCEKYLGLGVDGKVNLALSKSLLSVPSQSVAAQNSSTASHVQNVLIDSSTAGAPHSDCHTEPATRRVAQSALHCNNQQSDPRSSYSWIECDQDGWLYYVCQGRTRCLNIKKKDLSEKCLEVVYCQVSRILALELCLKYCSGSDNSNLVSFIEQEKTDAQDLEQLLNMCKINTMNNTKAPSTKSSADKRKSVKYHLNESSEAVTDKHSLVSDNSTTTVSSNTASFLNADHQSEDDSGLSIRIESVYSLSDTVGQFLNPKTDFAPSPSSETDSAEESQTSVDHQHVHQQPFASSDSAKTTSSAGGNGPRPTSTERNNPMRTKWTKLIDLLTSLKAQPYVVLERLTYPQVKKARHVSRCTTYCRTVTLQLMCDMGLTNCRKTCVKRYGNLWGPSGFNINCDHNYACKTDSRLLVKIGDKVKNISIIKSVKPNAETNRKVNSKFTKLSIDSNSVIRIVPQPGQNSTKKILKFTKVDKASIPNGHTISAQTCVQQPVNTVKDAVHSRVVKRPSQTSGITRRVKASVSSRSHRDSKVNANLCVVPKGIVCQTNITPNLACSLEPDTAHNVAAASAENGHSRHAVTAGNRLGETVSSTETSGSLPASEQVGSERRSGTPVGAESDGVSSALMQDESVHVSSGYPGTDQQMNENKSKQEVTEERMVFVHDKIPISEQSVKVSTCAVSATETPVTDKTCGLGMRSEKIQGQDSSQTGVTIITVFPKTPVTQTPTNTTIACLNHSTTETTVSTKCLPKQQPNVLTLSVLTKSKHVSLLPNNIIPTKSAIVLSSQEYRNPAGPRVASDIEIVLNTEDGSTPCTASTNKIDPKERYALCILMDTSYLVQLSKNETISVTACGGIIDRLVKHIAAKQKRATNKISLLPKPISSLQSKVQPASSSTSVSSHPVNCCEVVSSVRASSALSSTRVFSSSPRSLLNTFQNAKRAHDTHLEKDPHESKVPRLSAVKNQTCEKEPKNQIVLQPVIKDKITDGPTPTNSSAPNSPLLIQASIKKERVDQFHESSENVGHETVGFEPTRDSCTTSVKHPKKERDVGEWQQIWCSDVMPADDPEDKCASPPRGDRSSAGCETTRSDGSIFDKMYSEFNLQSAPSTSSDTKPLQTSPADCHCVLVSSGKPTAERRSLFDNILTVKTEDISQDSATETTAEHPDLPSYDVTTPPVPENVAQANIVTEQQMRIRQLKELLRQKEEELNQIREKNRFNSE